MSLRASWLRALAGLLAALPIAGAQNLRQAPTADDRAYAVKIGWPAAARELESVLRAGYVPGHGGVPGSAGNGAFQSWLLLDRWCELLARSQSDELARFFGRFLFVDASVAKNPRIVFVPPGQAAPAALRPVPLADLQRFGANPKSLATGIEHLLPAGFQPGSGTIADGLDPAFLAAMTQDETFLRAWFGVLSDRDFAPAALRTLQSIWSADRAKFTEYRPLAIALALVYDQRAPAWWPHPQVKPADVPRDRGTVPDRFRFWVASNEGRRLYTDLRRLSPEELKFVVDAPVDAGELAWAQKNAQYPRADFGRAFSAIDYRLERLKDQAYTWNDGPYTLGAIRDKGGICVDQAYFAALSGKARGLPTLFFTGQGADGGHAWFGYLKGENRWDMNCGRYENQNYAVGEALDPQTWLPINDHELASLAESFRRTPEYLAAQSDLVMARLFERAGDESRTMAALDSAISVSPRNDLAWAAKGEYLDRSGAVVAAKQAYHEAASKQFANNGDLRFSHQQALADLARGAGAEKTARDLESRIISQNRRTRSDLSVNAAAGRLSDLVDAGKYDDAMREYRNLLSRLGRNGGGNLFYEIVKPFADSLTRNGDAASARRAVDLARTALKPERGSILDQELAELAGAPPARQP